MLFPLLSAALQNSLTAALCQCNYTYEDLLIIQVCSDPTPIHCSTALGKMLFPLLSAALQNSLTRPGATAIKPLEICSLYRCAVTYHQGTLTLLSAKCISHWSLLLCKTGLQQACVTAFTPKKIC